jgi:hypothetical protein
MTGLAPGSPSSSPGRYPPSVFEYIEGVIRWHPRVAAYAFLLITRPLPAIQPAGLTLCGYGPSWKAVAVASTLQRPGHQLRKLARRPVHAGSDPGFAALAPAVLAD